jgi:GDPmannose 4,6-dehydratase
MKRVVIVGSEGQDGRLLSQLLQGEGVPCLRLSRHGLLDKGVSVPFAGLGDPGAVRRLVKEFIPTQIYYLAAHHHSAQEKTSDDEQFMWQESVGTHVLGLVTFLEAIRIHAPACRLFYAASSHLFGKPAESPQNEKTVFAPDSIYGITKQAGLQACRYYRRQYGQFTSVGILYTHESIYRQKTFVSQKIIQGALEIKAGRQQILTLGDLSAEVDWGYAPDFIDAMVRMLDQQEPDDYVVATGRLHSVRQFVTLVFDQLGIEFEEHVREDPGIIKRKPQQLVGDSSHLREKTGWTPTLSFEEMVHKLTLDCRRLASL